MAELVCVTPVVDVVDVVGRTVEAVEVDGGAGSVLDVADGAEEAVEDPVTPLDVAVVGRVVVGLGVVAVVEVGRVVLVRTPDSSASSVTNRPVWPA